MPLREDCVSPPGVALHVEQADFYTLVGVAADDLPVVRELRRVNRQYGYVRDDGRRVSGKDAPALPPAPAVPGLSDTGFDDSSFREVAFTGGNVSAASQGRATYRATDYVYRAVDAGGDSRSMGLTRATVGWTFEPTAVETGVAGDVDGYKVTVHPDPKLFGEARPRTFELGRFFRVDGDKCGGGNLRTTMEFNGFTVGGWATMALGPLTTLPVHFLLLAPGISIVVDSEVMLRPYQIRLSMRYHHDDFIRLVSRLPLAPGYAHNFEVAPYVEVRGTSERIYGRPATIYLSGNDAACWDQEDPVEYQDIIAPLYGCRSLVADYSPFPEPVYDPFGGVSLLSLAGWERKCTDLFSATPPGLTWDNGLVRNAWTLLWIIAGGVLFSQLVWQGLRMTYDVWLDPRPAVGLAGVAAPVPAVGGAGGRQSVPVPVGAGAGGGPDLLRGPAYRGYHVGLLQ